MRVIADNVRRIIDIKGLKQKAVAAKIGISERAFSDMMCQRKAIMPSHIAALCRALEVDANELFKELHDQQIS